MFLPPGGFMKPGALPFGPAAGINPVLYTQLLMQWQQNMISSSNQLVAPPPSHLPGNLDSLLFQSLYYTY